MTSCVDKLMDGLQPVVHGLLQLIRIHTLGHVIVIKLQVLHHLFAGHLASIVSTHAIGNTNDETVQVFW